MMEVKEDLVVPEVVEHLRVVKQEKETFLL
jgi:hypothetical protein